MSTQISANTQAILLLTAPLIAGKKAGAASILSQAEYNRFARVLHEKGREPADLLGTDSAAVIDSCGAQIGAERLKSLLGRGFLLSQAVDRWQSRSIWVVSRADSAYPRRLKARLKENAPPVLYGCGDPSLLDLGGLAVVGSRHVDEGLMQYTMNVGAMAAEARVSIVSGAAKGIDSSAMSGALESGGTVIGVMADSLERAALAKGNREALRDGRLVMISAYDPAAGFNVGHAMQRNKAIYALADAGLVVTSDFQKGGTWAGAVEQLEKYHFVPVFVRNGSGIAKGNVALLQRGGKPWPEPHNGEELLMAMANARDALAQEPRQESLELRLREEPPIYGAKPNLPAEAIDEAKLTSSPLTPAERLMAAVSGILVESLKEPMTDQEVAELLNVSKAQVKVWLIELVKSGALEKLSKPVRYRIAGVSYRLL